MTAEWYSKRATPGAALARCSGCRLAPPGLSGGPPVSAVYSEGGLPSKLVFVGEAPGKDEVRLGRPFVGGAGKILRGSLKRAGLRESEVWIANLALCQPPANELEQSEIDACSPRLLAELLTVQPDVIVALGEHALKTLTGKSGITKHRGSVYPMVGWPEDSHGAPPAVVATVHPSFVQRGQWTMLPALVADLRRAKRQIPFGRTIARPAEHFNLHPTVDEIESFLTMLGTHTQEVTIDIETVGRRWRTNLVCVGIGWGENKAIVVPLLLHGGQRAFTGEGFVRVVTALATFLQSSCPKVFHNGMYDVSVLESLGFVVNEFTYDTMLMHHTIYAELPHKLAFLTSIYTDWPYYKDMCHAADDEDEGKGGDTMLDVSDEIRHLYNTRDCAAPLKAYWFLRQELSETNLTAYYTNRVHPLIRPAMDMQNRGMLIDRAVLDRLTSEYEQKALAVLGRIRDTTGTADFNPRSNPQVRQYLHGHLGLKAAFGGSSADEDALIRLTIRYPEWKQLLLDICAYRSLTLIKATFLDGLVKRIDPDGRVYPRIMLHGTATGRFATRDPNVQNWPVALREMVMPTPGYTLFGGDASQLEERLMAYASGCRSKLRALDEGIDLHAQDAASIFGVDRKTITKHSPLRVLIKGFKYALAYGAGIDKIYIELLKSDELRVLGIEITHDDVRGWYMAYKDLHPELFAWAEQMYAQAIRDRRVSTAYGRVRLLFGPDVTLRGIAFNTPIQGSAADYLNDLLIRLWDAERRGWVWGNNAWLFNQSHDSLTGETKIEYAEEAAATLQRAGEQPVTMFGQTFVVPFETKIGQTWREV